MDRKLDMPRVALDSLGCKLNQAEIELLARQLAEAGYKLVAPDDRADVYILNTCTVTHVADRKSRHMLRQAHRRNPAARLVAIGCYAERAPGELEKIEGVDLILGNAQKPRLLWLLRDSENSSCRAARNSVGPYDHSYRTRSFIKVQGGCDNFCAYCIVPLVRSLKESVPVDKVVAEVGNRVADGYREVVLTGTEIGSYNNDVDLRGLLDRILAETAISRLRLSSLRPHDISPELIGLWRDERLCPHFHLSLQSGSDGVLRRMKRRYTTADYQNAVSLIRQLVPEVAITTDVIAGFPGETEAEFQASFDFCRQMQFARIHVFPYSPRPGTEAAHMPQAVDSRVKKQRSQKMLALAEESTQSFNRQFLGRKVDVLWEQKSDGIWSGLTGNYIKVYTRSSEDLTNRLLPVKLVELCKDGVWGEAL